MSIVRLPFDFSVPDYLERDIRALIDAIDGKNRLLDCETSEIIGSVNMAMNAGEISRIQGRWIRKYYAEGGFIHDMD